MTVRVALLGAGRVADLHASALAQSPRADLVAVADPDLHVAHALADRHGADTVAADPRAVLESVDAVIVAAPSRLHHSLTLEAIAAQRHALVEKPFTSTVAEACDIADHAAERAVQVVPAQVLRFLPLVDQICELRATGRLGAVHNVIERRLAWREDPFPWWHDSPTLLIGHWGSHSIDLAATLLDDVPARVYCTGGVYRSDLGFVDDCTVDVVFVGGTRFTSHLSFAARTQVHDVVVVASEATVEMHGFGELRMNGVSTTTVDPAQTLDVAFRRQLDAFVDAIDAGSTTVSLDSVLPSLRAIEAAETSYRTGAVVVPERVTT